MMHVHKLPSYVTDELRIRGRSFHKRSVPGRHSCGELWIGHTRATVVFGREAERTSICVVSDEQEMLLRTEVRA